MSGTGDVAMLEELARVGEFIGGLAVVISLVYLGYQSRQSNKFMVRQVRQSVTDSALTVMSAVLSNPEVFDALAKDYAGEDLTATEEARLGVYCMMFMNMLKNNFYHYQSGLITEEDWKGIIGGYARVINTPYFRTTVASWGTLESDDFGAFLKKYFAEQEAA